ncbi:hypothetical protein M8C21_029770 [Ambrosia artemisiifolia]|uniref:Phosphatase PP2A regulatory subunit A/Splicing factor 3B subunit 1-like HEAT repeat domain-containing protein n=1 Tax=Ambrosia artemisiifolia TaxID=4212 RepID=A0AAD5G8Y7_AMBAR|nr:hypothetical protein M8C21_029770 [Ambrosia artemisiifolia]
MWLLRDNEAEVRIIVAGKVTKLSRILTPEVAVQHILPYVKPLVDGLPKLNPMLYYLMSVLGRFHVGLHLNLHDSSAASLWSNKEDYRRMVHKHYTAGEAYQCYSLEVAWENMFWSVKEYVDPQESRTVFRLIAVLGSFCEVIAARHTTDLVAAYMWLLRDNEAEVRIIVAGKVTKLSRILTPEVAVQHILPYVKILFSMFGLLLPLLLWPGPVLGKDKGIQLLINFCLIFLPLLKDGFPDVRLNIISKLEPGSKYQACDSGVATCQELGEALKRFLRQTSLAKVQMQRMQAMEPTLGSHGIPNDRNALSSLDMVVLGITFELEDALTMRLRRYGLTFKVRDCYGNGDVFNGSGHRAVRIEEEAYEGKRKSIGKWYNNP